VKIIFHVVYAILKRTIAVYGVIGRQSRRVKLSRFWFKNYLLGALATVVTKGQNADIIHRITLVIIHPVNAVRVRRFAFADNIIGRNGEISELFKRQIKRMPPPFGIAPQSVEGVLHTVAVAFQTTFASMAFGFFCPSWAAIADRTQHCN
jgi:hypothetical protein